MCNIKAQSLLVKKLWSRLSFSKVGQNSRSRVKIFGMDRKVLPQGIHTCTMKALPLLVQKL